MAHLTDTSHPEPTLDHWLDGLPQSDFYDIGYPRGTDLPYPDLAARLAANTLINVGDPFIDGDIRHHSKRIERQLIHTIADVLGAPPERWGFVTTGSSIAIEHAITSARNALGDDLIVYTSAAAHGCITEITTRYHLPRITIRTDPYGSIDPIDLMQQLGTRRHRPAIIIATLGTTFGEAIDDLHTIGHIADELAHDRLHLHADAALAGLPLALLPDPQRPAATFADVPRLTSWSMSGHKFLSTREPSAILIYRQPPHRPRHYLPYTGTINTTVGCSRSGALPVILWHQLTRITLDQHHQRAAGARALADRVKAQLDSMDWPARKHAHSFSVVLARPPDTVLKTWGLSHQGTWSQIKCMPGVAVEQTDAFLAELRAARGTADPRTMPPIRAEASQVQAH